jgi:hypothetical protein
MTEQRSYILTQVKSATKKIKQVKDKTDRKTNV